MAYPNIFWSILVSLLLHFLVPRIMVITGFPWGVHRFWPLFLRPLVLPLVPDPSGPLEVCRHLGSESVIAGHITALGTKEVLSDVLSDWICQVPFPLCCRQPRCRTPCSSNVNWGRSPCFFQTTIFCTWTLYPLTTHCHLRMKCRAVWDWVHDSGQHLRPCLILSFRKHGTPRLSAQFLELTRLGFMPDSPDLPTYQLCDLGQKLFALPRT